MKIMWNSYESAVNYLVCLTDIRTDAIDIGPDKMRLYPFSTEAFKVTVSVIV